MPIGPGILSKFSQARPRRVEKEGWHWERQRSGIGGECPVGPITDAPTPMELSTKALIPQDRQRYGKTRVGPQCLSSLQGTQDVLVPCVVNTTTWCVLC